MTTKTYIVTNQAGANLRQNPSTTYPSKTPAGSKGYLDEVQVIPDWTATNSVGSETKYLPVLVDGKVLYCSAALLKQLSNLERAALAAPLVYDKIVELGCVHQSGATSYAEIISQKRTTCAVSASAVLQIAGCLPVGKLISHTAAGGTKNTIAKAMTGSGQLTNCEIVKIGATYAKMSSAYKKPGIVYVQDSNICVCAGDGDIYSTNNDSKQVSNGKYVVDKVNSKYPFSHDILYAIVPKS